ncbi:MAG TPA: glycosyl hydrolase family 18 protein [Gemmatimonadaceae bacterium]|nr:glycosyl hydrolase family 18 protein [Gemmatimonadaceae bacterium]
MTIPRPRLPLRAIAAAAIAAAAGTAGGSPVAAQTPAPQGLEALWYATGSDQSTKSFLAHAAQISIVAPQVFKFDATGHIDPRLVDAAHAHHVKLVPLVVNPGFDQHLVHVILTLTSARRRAIRALGALCRDEHLDGIQFDLENVNVADKAAFSAFVRESADTVHRAGCTLSAAVVPRLNESRGSSSYSRWMFDNWRGAYDYKALAQSLDFLSYMTYAQHTGNSTPGPVAGYPWMEECLQYVLSLGVPPEKISLGIPSYSDWWYPSYDAKAGPRERGRDISYAVAESLLTKAGAHAVWDDEQKSPVAQWMEDGVFQHLWVEDARAFAAKLVLVRKYHLRGYSVWVLGTEDPAVWDG